MDQPAPAANALVIAEPLPRAGGLVASRLGTSDQGAGDLGARLARAARRHLSLGRRVLMIGADCPGLSAQGLWEGAEALDNHEAALIRARDGAMCFWPASRPSAGGSGQETS